MIQDLLPMLPQTLGTASLLVCAVGLVLGWILWAAGAVWSRYVVTLIAVAVGGSAGLLLPRWYLWPVNPPVLAVLGAVVCGVLAFVIPRLFVGLTLGVILSAWAVWGTWLLLRGPAPFDFRQEYEIEQMSVPQHAVDIWQRLPEPVQRVVPYSVATAMISALCLTLLWPKLGRLLMSACLGVTCVFLCGLTLVSTQKPDWLHFIPDDVAVQAGILAALVLLGTLIQWQILPSKKEAVVLDELEQQQSPAP